MDKLFSMTTARNSYAAIVRLLEGESAVRITRSGKPIAVLLSIDAYERLVSGRIHFWSAFATFRDETGVAVLGIGPEVFADVRDLSPGRSAPGPEGAT